MGIFHVKNYLCSSLFVWLLPFAYLEGTWAVTLPFMGWLAIDFWYNFYEISDNEGGIETDTKLSDDVIFGITWLQILNELFRATFSDSS